MADICPKCGLPLEICVCRTLEREGESKIIIYIKKSKFNKFVTVVEGLTPAEAENTAKNLKRLLACGGTCRDSMIELQGKHRDQAKAALIKIGYKDSIIELE
jgi:translation initiation factor 1